MHVTVAFTRTATTVTARACVTMTETISDFTTGSGCQSTTVTVDNTAVLSPDFDVRYRDSDHSVDDAIAEHTALTSSPAVLGVSCTGDTTGDDICSATQPDCSGCTIRLGCVNVTTP